MMITPLLAIAAWYGVGRFAAEKPHKAVAGQHYPLVEQSNCRYASRSCELRNQDFRLELQLAKDADLVLRLSASHPLNGVLLAVAAAGADEPPQHMLAAASDGTKWQIRLPHRPGAEDRIRLVASAGESTYFAEASTSFLLHQVAPE